MYKAGAEDAINRIASEIKNCEERKEMLREEVVANEARIKALNFAYNLVEYVAEAEYMGYITEDEKRKSEIREALVEYIAEIECTDDEKRKSEIREDIVRKIL